MILWYSIVLMHVNQNCSVARITLIVHTSVMRGLGHQMKTALAASGIELGVIALRLGITTRALNHYFNDRSEPRLETLLEFCSVVGVPIGELLDFDPNHPEVDVIKIIGENDALVKIDVIDAYLSAGPGAENLTENIIGQIAFSTHLLDRMGVKPSAAKIVKVNGTSMEPTLINGSLVMVDMRDNTPTSKGLVYALRIDNETFVKRLEKIVNGPLLVHSDNPQLQTEAFNGGTDIHVIGKVVWSARTWPDNQL